MTDETEHECKIFYFDLYGTREEKNEFLKSHSVSTVPWQLLEPQEPYYFFVPKDFAEEEEYEKGFKIDELFHKFSSGIETGKDDLFVDFSKSDLENKIETVFKNKILLKSKYNIKETSSCRIIKNFDSTIYQKESISKFFYRPFDTRFIYYDNALLRRGFVEIMKNFTNDDNIALLISKQQSTFDFQHSFVTNYISDRNSISMQTREAAYIFPLYLLQEKNSGEFDFSEKVSGVSREQIRVTNSSLSHEKDSSPSAQNDGHGSSQNDGRDVAQNDGRVANFNPEIYAKIQESAGRKASPEEVFHYIYAVLHSPSYREKYKEFLKIDFPRIPYPKNGAEFSRIALFGKRLVAVHLLNDAEIQNLLAASPVNYPVAGSNVVENARFDSGRIYINETQYFEGASESQWNFYIGGYQSAQKWLKDRRGRTLTFDEIAHYKKILAALSETARIMQEIGNNE